MNADKEMQKILMEIQDRGERPRLLLNSCCGPCSTSVLEQLIHIFDVTVHFYNPNMDSEGEYLLRLENQKKVHSALNMPLQQLLEHGWQKNRWEAVVGSVPWNGEGGARCRVCMAHRMETTAKLAHELDFHWFTTTLSVSPHKDGAYLNQIGVQLSEQYHVQYLPADFKKRNGYRRSVELSVQWKLYRQIYCGCEASKTHRNLGLNDVE